MALVSVSTKNTMFSEFNLTRDFISSSLITRPLLIFQAQMFTVFFLGGFIDVAPLSVLRSTLWSTFFRQGETSIGIGSTGFGLPIAVEFGCLVVGLLD